MGIPIDRRIIYDSYYIARRPIDIPPSVPLSYSNYRRSFRAKNPYSNQAR